MNELDKLPSYFGVSESEVNKIICNWSMNTGTALTEAQLESMTDFLSRELTVLVVGKQRGHCGDPDCTKCVGRPF